MDGEIAEESISAVLRDLEASRGAACRACGERICGHEALFARLLGCRESLRCLECLSREHGRAPGELGSSLHEHIRRRECYLTGWVEANRSEGFGADELPTCVFPTVPAPVASPAADPPVAGGPEPRSDAVWNAGGMGCGDLVLELRARLRGMGPGTILHVEALDPGAPEDLPAWCRLTGHRLIAHRHPHYWIQRKET